MENRATGAGQAAVGGAPPAAGDAQSATAAHRAPALIWMAGPDGARHFVNRRWLQFTGRTATEELGEGWAEAVHPDDRDRCLKALREAEMTGAALETEYRLRRHDGAWRWMLDRSEALPAPGGSDAAGRVGACVDVTERRLEEQALHRSREDLRLALAAGNMGTWVWDRPSGRVTRDPNLHAMYGLDVSDTSGGSYDEWLSLVHPEDRDRVVADVERAMAEGGTYQLEHRIVRPDGTVRWLERRGETYRDESGAVAGSRGLVIDITARKQAEEERAHLLGAEQRARRAAEVSARRVTNLQEITGGLADARRLDEVAQVVVEQGAAGLDASSCALMVLSDDGRSLETVRQVGYHPDSMQRFRAFPVDADLPASDAVRSGEPVLLESLADRDARYPSLQGLPALNQAFAVVPLVVQRRPAGAVAVGWSAPRSFDEEDRAFLDALAHQAAQALDRVRLYEDQRWRAEHQGLLAEASRLLGSSFDYEDTLARLTGLLVPAVAEACSIHLWEEGFLRTVAMAHATEEGEARMREEPAPAWCMSVEQVAEAMAGQHTVVTAGEDGGWAMAVPLGSGDEALGVLVVAMRARERRRRAGEQAFLEDLASRGAAAVANGRSHQARTRIARTLQHSLLPPEAPVVPGLEVAARYRPVGHEVEVGGDFYDLFSAGGGRWGVVIGDVSGKGVLAASLTALARYTVRTAARHETSPSAVLRILNDSIIEHGREERFCTIALAHVTHDPEGVSVVLSCAGQPLPLLVGRHGGITPMGRPGTAVGLFSQPDLTDTGHSLEPGEVMVLFTDGVIEARSPEGAFADELLERTLEASAGQSAEAVACAIETALLEFTGGQPRDDTALLVLRRPPLMFHRHMRPAPGEVATSRRLLRAWLAEHVPGDQAIFDD
ncbi:MAG TPA: SpoIIE family protein phosphatase, partial [Acidimicrobiales bacterium]|nr:SpoIIE family protein phosphatase [Acidimicrobiales bacterium]